MGAHHAPVGVVRHARARHRVDATTSTPRAGRLAGGVLTASAALAMTGAGGGVAFAHDDSSDARESSSALVDSSFLCGILGGRECSDDTDDAPGRYTDAGSSDDARSLFDRTDLSDSGATRPAAPRSSTDAARPSGSTPTATDTPGAPSTTSLDTPPPPGQVRTIQVPG